MGFTERIIQSEMPVFRMKQELNNRRIHNPFFKEGSPGTHLWSFENIEEASREIGKPVKQKQNRKK